MTENNWWKGSVTYQIYPRSFQDDNGDGVGDIKGITRRLPHIADLGVDAIWLSPIFTSPMADMGYDISNYKDIDPSFGTLEDFDEMVARAHELGLKVIVDQVISHSSDEHPFFQESRQSTDNPKANWYVWADPNPDGSAPNNWMSIFGGIAWEWDTRRKQYYFHNFLKKQPDFNFHNPEVQDYMLGVMRFWLDRGVDGFRLDTVNFYYHDNELRSDPPLKNSIKDRPANPYNMLFHTYSKNRPENIAFLERMRALLDEYDARTMVGEVGEANRPIEMMGEYTTGKRLHMAYSFEMLNYEFNAAHFRNQITRFFDLAPNGWPCWAFSNHDVVRHVTRWMPHAKDQNSIAHLSAGLLLSLQGSICMYQGEELGQTETVLEYHELTDPQGITFWPADKGRDGCRTPMVWSDSDDNAGFSSAQPWLPIKPNQRSRAASTADAQAVMATYRSLLGLRRENEALRTGNTTFLDTDEPILAFTRADQVLCVFNLSNSATTFAANRDGTVMFAQNANMHNGAIELGPNGFIWVAL